MEIKRSTTTALGGVTDSERQGLKEHYQLWQGRHLRTTPIEPTSIVPAIQALYRCVGLATPHIIIVPSPGALAFAGTFASAIWKTRATDASYLSQMSPVEPAVLDLSGQSLQDATRLATLAAIAPPLAQEVPDSRKVFDVYRQTMDLTYSDADLATANATDRQTHSDIYAVVGDLVDLRNAVDDAMRDPYGESSPTPLMASAIRDWGHTAANGLFPRPEDAASALEGVGDWFRCTQGGNAAAYWEYRISAYRDILGLSLPEHANYAHWEQCAMHGSYRYMHANFCLLSDFPCEILNKNSPTRSSGTAVNRYRWRDGWTL